MVRQIVQATKGQLLKQLVGTTGPPDTAWSTQQQQCSLLNSFDFKKLHIKGNPPRESEKHMPQTPGSRIKHVIVLMLENRSADHLFCIVQPTAGQQLEGLRCQ